jgi:hypothetical protein
MEHEALIQLVNKELALELPAQMSMDEIREKLSAHINRLIQSNFEQLVNLLYRIDVSEAKIKSLLEYQAGVNAGDIIASLVIERQLQKIKSREQFKTNDSNFTEEEKW